MGLADEYRRQLAWRDWARALSALPPLGGRLVLDLGCAHGDLAAEMAARGAQVIGLDLNDELLAAARARGLPGARFERGDLRALPDLGATADGIWCSFAAAYLPDLTPALRAWAGHLRPGGWIALTEIDDLFGHEPVEPETRALLDAYAADALAAGRYDMHMGGKLRRHLEAAGFAVVWELELADRELAFDGPALPEVLEGWRARLARLKPLQDLCGPRFERLREDFLGCLARGDHVSRARVRFCLATRAA